MRIAIIHKPYFFPWMGYFAKLLHAQVFIVQDNVLASNRVWVNRSQIIRSDGRPHFITLPIGKKGDAVISTIQIPHAAREESVRRISMSVEHAYSRSRYFNEWELLKGQFIDIMAQRSRLLDIDMAIISTLLHLLRIPEPTIYFASDLQQKDAPLDTLVAQCNETGCEALILGGGNKEWTADDTDRLQRDAIEPFTLDFYGMHPQYYQTRREQLGFYPGLSILDCILNEGCEKTASLLKDVPLIRSKGA